MSDKYLRKYGEAQTINFELYEPDGVDLATGAVHASGDTTSIEDEGAEGNTTNGFTDEGSSYSIVLTATEMQNARIVVHIVDQTATKVWMDKVLVIETYGNASAQHAFDLDAATQDVNVTQVSGDSVAADNLEADYDGTGYNKSNSTIGTTTTNTDMVSEPLNAAQTQSECNDALVALNLDHLMAVADADDVVNNSVIAKLADSGATADWSNYVNTTDSQRAIRDLIAALNDPTAAEIVNEWESQSQLDPTGFHVNVKEVNDTAQTANDNGADINAILIDTNQIQGKLPTNEIMGSSDKADHDGDFVSAARQGYLDNLNISENVAGISDIGIVQNNIDVPLNLPKVMELPEAGNNDFRIELRIMDHAGNMEAPDSLPTITVYNQAGTSRNLNLQGDGTNMTNISTGRYYSIYRVDTSHALEELLFVATIVEGTNTKIAIGASMVRDDNKTKLDAIHSAVITTSAELAGVPAANASLQDKIEFLFMALRNKNTTTASQSDIHDDAGASIASASVSDDGTTLTVDEYA